MKNNKILEIEKRFYDSVDGNEFVLSSKYNKNNILYVKLTSKHGEIEFNFNLLAALSVGLWEGMMKYTHSPILFGEYIFIMDEIQIGRSNQEYDDKYIEIYIISKNNTEKEITFKMKNISDLHNIVRDIRRELDIFYKDISSKTLYYS